jgi:isoleucyl-tRNA synthetase
MLNREKLDIYSESPDKSTIMTVLFDVLSNIILLLAPINPMLTEEIYLKMFKPYMNSIGLKETDSIHLQNWPEIQEDKINLDLEDQMIFTKDLIELIRALKEENKIRLRWPNKKIIIVPKDGMPKLSFPDIITQIGNVKELEVKDSVEVNNNLVKAESKYCTVYLDISLDETLLAERVVNDLIRNLQFSRKKNNFKVGEQIKLSIGTNVEYLKRYINKNRDAITDKVTAQKLEIVDEELPKDEGKVFGKLNLCPNNACSASLKENIITKLEKRNDLICPYCKTKLEMNKIKAITFNFKKT